MGLPEFAYSTSRIECCACGIVFSVPGAWQRNRLETKADFYCPNGHRQSYTTSEAERLRGELEREKRKAAMLQDSLAASERQRDGIERERERLKRRVKAGACPCCNRSFVALARHIKTKHPNYGAPKK